MGKKQKKYTKQYIAEKYLPQLRELLQDWDLKVMSYVMIVIVMVATIAATVAWFTRQNVATASNMGFVTAECSSLKVEVKQGMTDDSSINFVEVEPGREESVLVDLDMPLFDNVESYEVSVGDDDTNKKTVSKMAPGVYGSLTIRLTPLGEDINHFIITPLAVFSYVGDTTSAEGAQTSSITQEEKAILEDLAKGHILFFEHRKEIPTNNDGTITIDGAETATPISNYTHNSKYVFYDQFDDENPMKGKLTWNTENNEGNPTEVTIYWYWPYEYANLSTGIKEQIQLPATVDQSAITTERLKYFDKAKMDEIVNNHISWDETQLYDYADTRIGTYVKSMKLHLKVKGDHAD